MNLVEITAVYEGSNGDATKALYAKLDALGPRGNVAMNLFRACKASARAKLYSRKYSGMAYDKKSWSLGLLCEALEKHGPAMGITWGWARDERTKGFPDVLYIDLPIGQVSFHNNSRKVGPDYAGKWDESRGTGHIRICRFAHDVINDKALVSES